MNNLQMNRLMTKLKGNLKSFLKNTISAEFKDQQTNSSKGSVTAIYDIKVNGQDMEFIFGLRKKVK